MIDLKTNNLYSRWRCRTLINGQERYITVNSSDGSEGRALQAARVVFGYPPYANRVQASPVRSSVIDPINIH